MLQVGDRVEFNTEAKGVWPDTKGQVGTIEALKTEGRSSGSTPLAVVAWDDGEFRCEWDSAWLKKRPTVEKFYILWNPSYPTPPRVRFSSPDNAQECAEQMARRNPGEAFYVCEIKALVRCEISLPKTTLAE